MTAKQIKYFGTKRQRAALRGKRKHRPASKRAAPRRSTSARKHRKATRRNVGGLYALTLNPAGGKMATTKKASRKHRTAGSQKKRTYNPGRRHHTTVRHHRRRSTNPGTFGSPKDWLFGGAGVLAGVVGTRAIPQMVLGTSNTGAMGYAANAVTTGLLTFLAHMAAPKQRVLSASVLAGGVAAILSRIIGDYSLLGSASAQFGLGDYLFSDFLTPQTLANGLQTAEINKPSWAQGPPPAPLNMQGAGTGMGSLIGNNLY